MSNEAKQPRHCSLCGYTHVEGGMHGPPVPVNPQFNDRLPTEYENRLKANVELNAEWYAGAGARLEFYTWLLEAIAAYDLQKGVPLRAVSLVEAHKAQLTATIAAMKETAEAGVYDVK